MSLKYKKHLRATSGKRLQKRFLRDMNIERPGQYRTHGVQMKALNRLMRNLGHPTDPGEFDVEFQSETFLGPGVELFAQYAVDVLANPENQEEILEQHNARVSREMVDPLAIVQQNAVRIMHKVFNREQLPRNAEWVGLNPEDIPRFETLFRKIFPYIGLGMDLSTAYLRRDTVVCMDNIAMADVPDDERVFHAFIFDIESVDPIRSSLGFYYGYPACCIDSFQSGKTPFGDGYEQMGIVNHFAGTGFMPCPRCVHTPRAELEEWIAANRKARRLFPKNDMETDTINHYIDIFEGRYSDPSLPKVDVVIQPLVLRTHNG